MKTFNLLLLLIFTISSTAQSSKGNPAILLEKQYIKTFVLKNLIDKKSNKYLGPDPLYIIDGAHFTGNFENIDSSTIKSILVLKDDESKEIHESLSKYGIVLITTKNIKNLFTKK